MTGPILYSVNLTEQCKYKDLTTINSNQRVKQDHHIVFPEQKLICDLYLIKTGVTCIAHLYPILLLIPVFRTQNF